MGLLGLFTKKATQVGRATILLVEDEPENQLLGRMLLGTLPVNLLLAASGSACLSIARANPDIDLILLDIVMPGMDGLQALELLKADPKTKDIPVLMLSSRERDYDRAQKLGAWGCLPKPYDNDVFVERIRSLLGLPQP